jgi:hypothetical protein
MKRNVNLRLGDFTLYALTGEEKPASDRIQAGAVRALRFYLSDKEFGGADWAYPGFLPDVEGHGELGLELTVDEELWSSLEREAERQGVSPTQLAEHAALYFAANWDAGRRDAGLMLNDRDD